MQGGPLAGKQITQEKLVYMLTEITKAQLLALRVGRIKDAGKLDPAMVSLAKRNNVDVGAHDRARSRATCSARTASSTTTRRCGTW